MFKHLMYMVSVVLLGLTLTLPGSAQGAGDQIVVVLNARNPTKDINTKQLKNIYLGNVAFWHGVVPITVLSRPDTSDASKVFFDDVLHMSAQRFDGHWSSRQLAGQGVAPTVVGSAEDLAAAVKASPGAIGFMLASEAWGTPPDGLTVVELK